MQLIKSDLYLDVLHFCTFSTLQLNKSKDIRRCEEYKSKSTVTYAVCLNQTLVCLRLQEVIAFMVQGCVVQFEHESSPIQVQPVCRN